MLKQTPLTGPLAPTATRPSSRPRPKSPDEIAAQINADESVTLDQSPTNTTACCGIIKTYNGVHLGWVQTGLGFDQAKTEALNLSSNESDLDIDCEVRLISPAHRWLATRLDRTAEPLDPLPPCVTALETAILDCHRRIEDAHVLLWQMSGQCDALATRHTNRVADLEHALTVEEAAHANTRTDAAAVILRLEDDLKNAKRRIGQLEHDGLEKDKGMTLIRQAFNEAGITEGRLDERIQTLVAERDDWKHRARKAGSAEAITHQ